MHKGAYTAASQIEWRSFSKDLADLRSTLLSVSHWLGLSVQYDSE
jgi:hypothetical protein